MNTEEYKFEFNYMKIGPCIFYTLGDGSVCREGTRVTWRRNPTLLAEEPEPQLSFEFME